MTLWLLKRGEVIAHRYYVRGSGKKSALTPNQVADWLQVSVGSITTNKTTIEIWQQYRGQMNVPARGKVAAARGISQARRTGMIL
jgi:biofilm PGA synthesis protein PgaA